jgi:hypothetical protein
MAITTEEFEQRLNDLLTTMESWPRCEWCGCDGYQRRTAANGKMCDACKEWKRRERRAVNWIAEHPELAGTEQYMRVEYNIEYAALCRQEGRICKWKKFVADLDLERELKAISERLCGEDVFGTTTFYFEHFSNAQKRLLMFLYQELTKVSVRQRRRSIAIDNVAAKHFPGVAVPKDT